MMTMMIVMIMKVLQQNISIYRLDIVDTKKIISLRGDDENDSEVGG